MGRAEDNSTGRAGPSGAVGRGPSPCSGCPRSGRMRRGVGRTRGARRRGRRMYGRGRRRSTAAARGDPRRAERHPQAVRGPAGTAVVVAPDRDDTSVLVTLTARELNRHPTIVSAVREAQNVHLLRESGADSVITSSGAAGRLLGIATHSPTSVRVLEDLLEAGTGLDLVERPPRSEELGPEGRPPQDQVLVAVVRDGEVIGFDDERARRLEPEDRLVCVCVNSGPE